MGIRIMPLSPALGAEISGADVAAGLSDANFAAVREAWFDHGMIVLRDQNVSEDQQVAFGTRFGPVAPWSRFADKVDS